MEKLPIGTVWTKPRGYYTSSIPNRFMNELGWRIGDIIVCKKGKNKITISCMKIQQSRKKKK